MNIELRRKLIVQSATFCGTISLPVKRAVEQSIVIWAEQKLAAGIKPTDADLVADPEGPLPGRPAVLARRLIEICAQAKLLIVNDRIVIGLTEAGNRVIRDGRVFMPHYATWRVWWSEDAQLPHPVLKIEKANDGPAKEDVWDRREESGARLQSAAPVLARCMDRLITIPGDGEFREVQFGELGSCTEVRQSQGAELELNLQESGPAESWLIGSGEVGSFEEPMSLAVDPFEQVWESIRAAHGLEPLWNRKRSALFVEFKPDLEEAMASFRMPLLFRDSVLPKLGQFDSVSVKDIPIEPASLADAQSWLEWLILRGVKGHVMASDFKLQVKDVVAKFPRYRVKAPTAAALAERVRGDFNEPAQPKYWHLQAHLDLEALLERIG